MPQHTYAVFSVLIMLATYSLLQTADAQPGKSGSGGPKSKKDRDNALDAMQPGKPDKVLQGITRGPSRASEQSSQKVSTS